MRAGWVVAVTIACAGTACSSQQIPQDTCTPAGGACVTSATECSGALAGGGFICPIGASDAPADCCFPILGGLCGTAACPVGGVCSGDAVCTTGDDASYPAGCGTITCEGDCSCVDASVCACVPGETTFDAGHPDGAATADL